ncbi:IS605 OrfB family transposase [Lentzea atacamensis]|uniref:IS605 OrfB family transposase n=1 Tax=Lentzea atacamensis TaxID=531938 RepID=A0ABX9ELW0_9PSEU|nr:IS605 OrfB family transposase [Lentzea atacamensis]
MHSWAFAQLGQFLTYKAQQAGVVVVVVQVDPAYTSQTCQACGHADYNAAHNIAARGVVRWGEVMRPDAAPILAAS